MSPNCTRPKRAGTRPFPTAAFGLHSVRSKQKIPTAHVLLLHLAEIRNAGGEERAPWRAQRLWASGVSTAGLFRDSPRTSNRSIP